MPDVFKILKDLELKAVGLDPQTNKMQEGYFVSFRSIGLPIHSEDYENPFDPLGGHLEQALEKPLPNKPAVDPKDASKTASQSLDQNVILAARVAKSMKSYLNTFLLTDHKLKMNNLYAVMPGSSKVSDSWWAIIQGANGIPGKKDLDPAIKQAYEQALAKLMDSDGVQTPHYKAYLECEKKWRKAVTAYNRAYADASTDPMKLWRFPQDGVIFQQDVDEAWDQWQGFGFMSEIQEAIATLAAQGTDPAIALISRAKKRFQNCLLNFPAIGDISYTIMEPNTWCDEDNDDGWNKYSSTDFHTEGHYTASTTAYGGGAFFSNGLWSAGGTLDHAEGQSSLGIQTDDLEITFKYCCVDIERPWLDTSLLNLGNWFLKGDYKKGCISNGCMGQELPQNAIEPTFLPSIVTSLILIKDLSIKWNNWKSDWSSHSETIKGSGAVGCACFAIGGSYSRGDGKVDFVADDTGESLRIPGIQLVGYVSTINPLSPRVNSSDYMTSSPT